MGTTSVRWHTVNGDGRSHLWPPRYTAPQIKGAWVEFEGLWYATSDSTASSLQGDNADESNGITGTQKVGLPGF